MARASATQIISHGTCQEHRLISFDESILFSLVTMKLLTQRPFSRQETPVTLHKLICLCSQHMGVRFLLPSHGSVWHLELCASECGVVWSIISILQYHGRRFPYFTNALPFLAWMSFRKAYALPRALALALASVLASTFKLKFFMPPPPPNVRTSLF